MQRRWPCLAALLLCLVLSPAADAQQAEIQTSFRVKYVAEGAVYLEGGRAAGLAEGQRLEIKRKETNALPSGTSTVTATRIIAQLMVVSVAELSTVCEVKSANAEVRVGDVAALAAQDARAMVERRASSATRKYLQVITFSEGDPLDEEVRDSLPRPPSPVVNRARGRIGVEYGGLAGSATRSAQLGVVLRMDVTRIGGTYWNLSGYWRGRLNSRSAGSQPQTLTDLINRTYHLAFTYSNPTSRWVAGFGRLYVPWASSLSTIDGGYFGRRVGRAATVGLFVGSTPDPTSWNYDPDRRIPGAFVNFEGGNYNAFHYTSTLGFAVSALRWRMERPFVFFENSLSFKRFVSLYHTLEADRPRLQVPPGRGSVGVSRSYSTLRVQMHPRVAFDLNHNYFRDFPTFDPSLVGTGLVDKLLFQGLSGGVRLDLPRRIGLYTNVGRSSKTGDARSSWNQLYGISLGDVPWVHLRADLRFSKFDSAFGRGSYRSLSLSRPFGEDLRLEVQAGSQNFASPLTRQSDSHFVSITFDWFLSPRYFLGTGFTVQRGLLQNYEQWFVNFGYRF